MLDVCWIYIKAYQAEKNLSGTGLLKREGMIKLGKFFRSDKASHEQMPVTVEAYIRLCHLATVEE
jgi:hypothetical protein